MAEESDLERTEAPSQRRLEQAREEGQVPRSRELNTLALLAAAGFGVWLAAERLRSDLSGLLRAGLTIDAAEAADPSRMGGRFVALSFEAAAAVAPLLAVLLLVALVAPMLLSGWLVSSKALAPDFSRLNPAKGFRNMFSTSGLAELAKAIAKVVLIAGVRCPPRSRTAGAFSACAFSPWWARSPSSPPSMCRSRSGTTAPSSR
jgi:flagellar biosynthetic protein FlhB